MVSKVKCPQCGKSVAWQADEIWKPFCSERCKLIDLGEWATEGHRIAGEPANDSDEAPNPSEYH